MHRFFGPFSTGRVALGLLVFRVFFGWGLVLHSYQKWTHGDPFRWGNAPGIPRLHQVACEVWLPPPFRTA